MKAPGYESIPVKIEVTIYNPETPEAGEHVEIYNMFDFRPGLNIREDAYYVNFFHLI